MRSRCALTSALVAAAAVFVPFPSHAQAAPGIVITTVPRLAHVHFRIDGKPFHSDASGLARETVSGSGEHVLEIRSPARARSKRRVRFVAWSDGSKRATRSIAVDGTTRIAVGVDVDYIVAEQWRDARGDRVDARLLDSLTFVDEEGKTQTVAAESPGLAGPTALIWQRRPAGTRWLLGTDVEYTADGLESHDVGYEIASARTGFGDIGARAAPFYPARSDTWPISLSAYIGKINAKGLIAGTPSDVVVTVSGEGDEIGVPDGETLLLGAGDYVAKTNSGGLSPGSSFSLPGPATIGVTVIGWLDVVTLLSLAVIVAGIVVASRRRRPAERAPLPSPIAVSHKAPPSPLDRISSAPHGVAPPPTQFAPPP